MSAGCVNGLMCVDGSQETGGGWVRGERRMNGQVESRLDRFDGEREVGG